MKGLTLIEMLIALALVVILTLIAISSFRPSADRIKENIAQTQLLQQLQRAQQISNAKMINVAVCLSDDGKTCAINSGAMLLVFIDQYADGTLQDDAQLISRTLLKGGGVLHMRAYPHYRNYILLQPTVMHKSDNGTFWYCKPSLQWAIHVSQSGEPHVVRALDDQLVC